MVEETSDCILVVKGEKFCLHKKILAAHSPVFERAFFGAIPCAEGEIRVAGVRLDVFKQLLEFVYENKRDFSFKSAVDAWSLYDVADRYLMDTLMDLCVIYIEQNRKLSDLLFSYEHAELYNLEKLMITCARDIAMYTKGVFLTSYHIKPSTWCVILNAPCNANVEQLAECAVKWAVDECDFRKVKCDADNVWEVMCEADLAHLARHLIAKDDADTKLFKTLKSKSDLLPPQCNKCYQTIKLPYQIRTPYKISKNVRLRDGESLNSTVCVNTKIALFGIAVSTEHQPSYAVNECYTGGFTIEIYDFTSGKLLFVDESVKETRLRYDAMHYVNFERIVIFEPATYYVISVRYRNSVYQSEMEVLCHYLGGISRATVTFSFFNEFYGSALRGLSFYEL